MLEMEKMLTTAPLYPEVVLPPGQTYEFHRQAQIAVSLEMLMAALKIKHPDENEEDD